MSMSMSMLENIGNTTFGRNLSSAVQSDSPGVRRDVVVMAKAVAMQLRIKHLAVRPMGV